MSGYNFPDDMSQAAFDRYWGTKLDDDPLDDCCKSCGAVGTEACEEGCGQCEDDQLAKEETL